MNDEYPVLTVEEAVARFLSHFEPLESERTPILDALGQVLAEDVDHRPVGSPVRVMLLDWPERG